MTPAPPTLVDVSQLVGIRDIAERYGVAGATVCVWRTRYPAFPAPVCHVSSGPVFLMPDVERWHASRRTT
jgi:hypothetical protein